MTRPIKFAITTLSNENLETTLAFKWVASQWPLPAGSYFEADIRDERGSSGTVVSFASINSPRTSARQLTTVYDSTTNILYIGVFAPKSALANFGRTEPYVMDVLLVRPRGTGEPRRDVIGEGYVTIKQGVTHD